MWTHWVLLPAAVVLSLLGAAATAFRSALLILGEEGLSEAASAGDGRQVKHDEHAAESRASGADTSRAARRLLAAVRDPALAHPFSLWVAAAALKVGSAVGAGAGGFALVLSLPGWKGPTACAAWLLSYLLLILALENAATLGAIGKARRVLGRGGACLAFMRAAAGPARLLDRAGRALFGGRYMPEALMDIRFGSEEGILDVIEEGAEHGTIDSTEERMIEGVLKFGETAVSEVMTPWSEVVALKEGMSRDEVAAVVGNAGFSRFPVLARGGEEVVGILASRDLLRQRSEARWESVLEKPLYVPESMKISDLFRQFRRSRVHLAVAIDEHGKLCGVITLHDLLEKIVGRLAEGADSEPLPEWEKDGALSVPAATPIRVLREEYGIDIPAGATYETAGGFALDCLQYVPEGQVTFRAHGYRVTVTETERFRIRRLRFEKALPTGTT
ncbi:MAG: hemolysin family protein [Gemmatimonadota bacterium]